MSKQSVLQRPKRNAKLPRNSFDRGFRINFNTSAGILLPTFCQFVEGDSHCKINLNSFLRTAQVNTAAFTIMDFHTEFFAVPIRQLLSTWGVFRTRTNDIHSTKYSTPPVTLPNFTVSEVYAAMNSAPGSWADGIGYDWSKGATRLLDLLNYGINVESTYGASEFTVTNVALNPFAVCAYQKVYYDHFRNSSYEKNEPQSYNLDQFINSDGSVQAITRSHLHDILKLHYVDYRKDFVSNVYPSLYYVKQGSLQGVHVPSNIMGMTHTLDPQMYADGNTLLIGREAQAGGSGYFQRPVSVQSVRAAFAVDKLIRLSAYAPQHVVDQFAARFGYRPSGSSMDESIRLGSFKTDIIIGEVTSTSNTLTASGGDGLGALGGKGIGSSDYGHTITYDAKEDCIVIGVSYVLPRIMYDSIAIDAFNFKFLPEDYVVPEMMDMGLQPLYLKQIGLPVVTPVNTQQTVVDYQAGNFAVGYQPRYSEYKIGIDRNHGVFNKGHELSAFTTHSRSKLPSDINSISGGQGISYTMLKCDPADLNSVFVEDYDANEAHDQFFGTIQFAFACVQNLSVHGESNL